MYSWIHMIISYRATKQKFENPDWFNGGIKIWMLCLSLNAFPVLVYTSKHILFFTYLFTLFELEFFWFLIVHPRGQEGKSDPVIGWEIKDQDLVNWTSFFIFYLLIFCVLFLSHCVQLLFHPDSFHPTICNSRGQEGNPNPVIGREVHGTLLSFH